MPYLYEGHMGSIYITEEEQDYDSLYCETCGDSDRLIGFYKSLRDLLIEIEEDIDIGDEGGGFRLEYILNLSGGYFDDEVTVEDAKSIVKIARSGHTNIR